jgi:peptide-methionine (S)-S-oxide reductase
MAQIGLFLLFFAFAMAQENEKRFQIATFGGGCFWCTEAIFKQVKGVEKVIPGYSGGHVPNPTYEQVCSGTTNHAEVVQITFDPQIISYQTLVEIFMATHDPTSLNRQGNDIGTQYRSVIFYHNEEQKKIAQKVIQTLEAKKLYEKPIVTALEPFRAFYPAEEYHHNYFERNPNQPYCQFVIAPKVAKFREKFRAYLK